MNTNLHNTNVCKSMKRNALFLVVVVLLYSCGNGTKTPDVSGITVTLPVERFDQAFFAVDTNNIAPSLHNLAERYPYFTNDFVVNILGVEPLNDTSFSSFVACRNFISTYASLKDSLEPKFRDLSWLQDQLQQSFRFIKYYFPNYQLPKRAVTYIGPFDAPAVALTPAVMAIGLQLFAGRNFSFYTSLQGQEIYPKYISRRFEPDYMAADCIKTISEDIFPDSSEGRPLIEQMVDKGKYWWLLEKLMPATPDSIWSGFSQKQLDWCQANEGLIWNFFLQTSDELYTIDPDIIKNYIGEAPNTPGMPDISPGNIGQWVGFQIVKKWAQNNSGISPLNLMRTDPKRIFEEAKYKPR